MLLDLMRFINAEGKYRALYANIDGAQAARYAVASGIATVVSALGRAADVYWKDPSWSQLAWQESQQAATQGKDSLTSVLQHWSLASDKPLIIFLDEVDALIGSKRHQRLGHVTGYSGQTSRRAYRIQFNLIACHDCPARATGRFLIYFATGCGPNRCCRESAASK